MKDGITDLNDLVAELEGRRKSNKATSDAEWMHANYFRGGMKWIKKAKRREQQSKREQRENDELLEEAIKALLGGCMLFSFGDRADKRVRQIILWLQELREYRNRDAELDEVVSRTMKRIDEMSNDDDDDDDDWDVDEYEEDE